MQRFLTSLPHSTSIKLIFEKKASLISGLLDDQNTHMFNI